MRNSEPKYYGVLAPQERDEILEECRSGDFHNLHWLERHFAEDGVEPETCGISEDELRSWRDANRSAS